VTSFIHISLLNKEITSRKVDVNEQGYVHGRIDEQAENTMLFACFVNECMKNNKTINIRPKSITIQDS